MKNRQQNQWTHRGFEESWFSFSLVIPCKNSHRLLLTCSVINIFVRRQKLIGVACLIWTESTPIDLMSKWYITIVCFSFFYFHPCARQPSSTQCHYMPTRCQFVLENFHTIYMKNRRAARSMIHMHGEYIVSMKIPLFVLRR